MDWLSQQWAIVVLAVQSHAYFSALINPLGLIVSGLVLALGALWGNGRKGLYLGLFAVWSLVPLHHFTLEGRDFVNKGFGGYGGLSNFGSGLGFFVGLLVVGVVIVYFTLVRE
jgi:hypothetical protein